MATRKSRHHLIAAALAASSLVAATPAAVAEQPAPGQPGFGELLIKAAKASPGCLGIETGRTTSGTLVIFAWFENKKAIVTWYKSDFHQRAMKSVFPKQNFNRETAAGHAGGQRADSRSCHIAAERSGAVELAAGADADDRH